MITAKEVDQVYFQHKNELIEQKNCVDTLLRLVIENRYFFGLEKLNDDALFDYLFFVYPKIFECLKNFDKEKSSFCSYFQNLIRMEYLTWRKTKMKENLKNQALLNYHTQEYSQNESNYLLASDNTEDTVYQKTDYAFFSKRGKRELYVIILKSIDYLTSNQISHLTQFYGLDFNELSDYMAQAKEAIKSKNEQIEKFKEMTNKDFIKREELRLGLKKFEVDSPTYCTYYNEYIKVCQRYQKRKEKLKKMKAIPSDKEVGRILNIPPTNVRYIMKKYYNLLNIDKNDTKK